MASDSIVHIATLRESGRGVSAQMSDHMLSHPSMLSADTPKQRGCPLGSADTMNSGAIVVPSSPHSPHTGSSSEKEAL